MPTFKVGDTVIFNDYDALRDWFMANVPNTAFLSKRDDVMVVLALWDVGQLYVECQGEWEGVLPSRFFKHAEGDSNAHPSQK